MAENADNVSYWGTLFPTTKKLVFKQQHKQEQ